MQKDRVCTYCSQIFENIDGKIFANHVRWCDKNTSNGDKGKTTIRNRLAERKLVLKGEKCKFTVQCKKCFEDFVVEEYEKCHPERDVYYCTQTCANSRGPMSDEMKKRIGDKQRKPKIEANCAFCNCVYIKRRESHRFCLQECWRKNRYKHLDQTSFKRYRQLCAFKFSLNEFPDKFDFSLIEKFGWYKAKNHGNNLNGVSRDHMVSCRFGFDNKIDPSIISHPANCQLMVHSANTSKGKKCVITLEELQKRIEEWKITTFYNAERI